MAKAAQDRRDKQLHKQTKAVAAAAAAALAPPTTVAKSKPDNSKKATAKSSSTKGAATAPTSSVSAKSKPSVVGLQQSLAAISLDNDEEVQKQLKKMRKKIREIEAIEEKLKSGDLKTPEQDQLDKVARKADILRQIAKLEALWIVRCSANESHVMAIECIQIHQDICAIRVTRASHWIRMFCRRLCCAAFALACGEAYFLYRAHLHNDNTDSACVLDCFVHLSDMLKHVHNFYKSIH